MMDPNPNDPTVGMVVFLWLGGILPILGIADLTVSEAGFTALLAIPIVMALAWTGVCWYGIATGRVQGRRRKELQWPQIRGKNDE